MQKLIQISIVVMAAFIAAGFYFMPDSALMSLADTRTSVGVLRALIATGSLALLFTNPPRKLYMRVIFAAAATSILTWGVYATYGQNLPVLDALFLIISGITFAIAALELSPQPNQSIKPRQIQTQS